MSSEVQVLRLKDCIERVIDNRGKTPPLSNEVSLHPLLEVNSIVGSNKHPDLAVVKKYVDDETYSSWFRSGHPEVGDLLFSTVGSIAEVAIVKEENGCIAQNLIGIKTNKEILDAEFLYYFLTNPSTKRMVCSLDISSVQPSIKVPHLLALEIAVPTLGVQEKIVNILSSLDDRITLLRETNATLEAIAQAIFKSWFVDFDPVHANAHARAQNQNSNLQAAQPNPAPHAAEAIAQNLGLDAATAALFPDHFQDSDLGLIPAEWSAKLLGEVYEINPTRKLKKGDVAPYLDMASVATQGHTVDGVINREMGSGSKFINGDTLLARITPCLENGKTAFVDFLDDEQVGWGSTEFVVMRPKRPLPPYHGYLLARFPAFRDFAIQSMSGTSGRQRVQNDVLAKCLIAVPSNEVANAFSEKVCCIQQTISANQQQAQTLTQLRDTLLPRLISGQLRLPDAEAQIEAVVGGA